MNGLGQRCSPAQSGGPRQLVLNPECITASRFGKLPRVYHYKWRQSCQVVRDTTVLTQSCSEPLNVCRSENHWAPSRPLASDSWPLLCTGHSQNMAQSCSHLQMVPHDIDLVTGFCSAMIPPRGLNRSRKPGARISRRVGRRWGGPNWCYISSSAECLFSSPVKSFTCRRDERYRLRVGRGIHKPRRSHLAHDTMRLLVRSRAGARPER